MRQRAQRYPCAAVGELFVPAAGARSARDHGAGPTKTAGCKQDMSGARGGRRVSTLPDKLRARTAACANVCGQAPEKKEFLRKTE